MIPREGRPVQRKSHSGKRYYSPDPKFNQKHNVNKVTSVALPYSRSRAVNGRLITKQLAIREIKDQKNCGYKEL